jgi:uncharacterized protein (DUF983 family)
MENLIEKCPTCNSGDLKYFDEGLHVGCYCPVCGLLFDEHGNLIQA